MKIIGKTTDGTEVVSEIGKLYYETGVPLSVIFDNLQAYNQIPSWNHLVNELRENGMTYDRIRHLLHEHVFESYGKTFRDHVITTIDYLNAKRQ